ncbi:hypothetical protein YC2023_033016 [Brassica napus]
MPLRRSILELDRSASWALESSVDFVQSTVAKASVGHALRRGSLRSFSRVASGSGAWDLWSAEHSMLCELPFGLVQSISNSLVEESVRSVWIGIRFRSSGMIYLWDSSKLELQFVPGSSSVGVTPAPESDLIGSTSLTPDDVVLVVWLGSIIALRKLRSFS